MDINPRIERASTLPGSFYKDAGLFREAADRIFLPSWQYLGESGKLSKAGDCKPITLLPGILDEPLLWVRGQDEELRLMSNVCTHRGNLLITEEGNYRDIRCGYHGRKFDLSGCYRFMPETKGMEQFPSEKDNLTRVAYENAGPLLFGSLQPRQAFDTWIKPLTTRLGRFPWNALRHDPLQDKTYEVKAHWALYVDNNLEGFHIPFVHEGLLSTISMHTYHTELLSGGNLQLAEAAEGEQAFDLPESSPDFGRRIAAYYFWLFPNTMFNIYPWGLSLNVVQPVSLNLTRVLFRTFILHPGLTDRGAGSQLHRVEMEDEAIVERVQQGVTSRLYREGRFSPRMEKGVHQFHRMLAAALSASGGG